MAENLERETLLCLGGPLNTVRLSVPTGLRWFTLVSDVGNVLQVEADVTAVVDWEHVAGIVNSSTTVDWDAVHAAEHGESYIRKSFVSGEHGLVHVFQHRPAPDAGST